MSSRPSKFDGCFSVADPATAPVARYEEAEDRIKSFTYSPSWKGPVDARSMSEAGFVYSGQEDLVYCFNCNIKLDGWTKHMDPLLRHKVESSTCSFVRQQLQVIKGEKGKVKSVVAPSKPLNPQQTASIGQLQSSTLFSSKPIHTVVTGLDEPRSSYVASRSDDYLCAPINVENYCLEEERLKSFVGWPLNESVHPEQLARVGFVYTGEGSLVQCFQCGVGYRNWLKGDIPLSVHQRCNSCCAFLQTLVRERNKAPEKQKPYIQQFSQHGNVTLNSPDYSDQATRLQSFKYWGGVLPKEELAEAGFYMIAHRDVVRCFSCHVVLQDWERTDNVIDEHRRHSPNCEYLYQLLHTQTCASSSLYTGSGVHCPAPPLGPSSMVQCNVQRFSNLPQLSPIPGPSVTQGSSCGGHSQREPLPPSDLITQGFRKDQSVPSPPINKRITHNTAPAIMLNSLPAPSQPIRRPPVTSVLMCPPYLMVHQTEYSETSCGANVCKNVGELTDDNQQKNFNPAQQVSNEAIEGIEPASFPHDIEYDPNFVYCKICYKEQVNTLFLPCLHVRTCTDCTDKILCRQQGQCPFCRKIITKTMLIYT